MGQVADWLGGPGAVCIGPTRRHVDVRSGLLTRIGTGGNLVNDGHAAVLAAVLAVEYRAMVVSYDSEFGRFDGVRWRTPDALLR